MKFDLQEAYYLVNMIESKINGGKFFCVWGTGCSTFECIIFAFGSSQWFQNLSAH